MKRFLLNIIPFFATLFVATSCDKDPDEFIPTPENTTTINFEIGYLTSDKPADLISPTKSFEDEIKIYKLWIFRNSDDEAILFKDFTAEEIKAMNTKIEIPKIAVGDKLTFISIANYKSFNHTHSKKQVLKIYDYEPEIYNAKGSYNDLMTKSLNPEGFTMSSTEELIATVENTYTVRTKLQKTVSKIEVFVDNYYMRNGNIGYDPTSLYRGIFQATRLTIKGDCNSSLFDKNKNEVEVQGGAINTEEYKLTGIGYFGAKDGGSNLIIRLWANDKSPGTQDNPSEYFTEYHYQAPLNPNKHYKFYWTKVGSSCTQIVLDKIVEKDWVKNN